MFEIKGYLILKDNYSEEVVIGLNRDWDKVHYDKIAKDIKTTPLRIIDIGNDGHGYLCFAPDGSCIIDIRNNDDVHAMFRCTECNGILCPPELENDFTGKVAYVAKIYQEISKRHDLMISNNADIDVIARMPKLLRNMTIMTSLMKGKLTDTIYFQYSNE